MEILESEIQEQKQQIHWMLSTTNEDREMSKWSWRQTTEIIQSKEHKEIRHGKKKKRQVAGICGTTDEPRFISSAQDLSLCSMGNF